MSYASFNSAVNDTAYMDRLLSGEWVAKRTVTRGYVWALVNIGRESGTKYQWWKLDRKTYKLTKVT